MENFTAFAVIEILKGRFQPSKVVVEGGKVVAILPLHEAMPYEAVAYEYLQGDVSGHYASRWKAEKMARLPTPEPKRGPGRPKRA